MKVQIGDSLYLVSFEHGTTSVLYWHKGKQVTAEREYTICHIHQLPIALGAQPVEIAWATVHRHHKDPPNRDEAR